MMTKLVMGAGQFFCRLGRSGQPFLVWVRKFPLKISTFKIFSPSDKKNMIAGLGQKVLW